MLGHFNFFKHSTIEAMKNRVENIQTAGYNGVLIVISR